MTDKTAKGTRDVAAELGMQSLTWSVYKAGNSTVFVFYRMFSTFSCQIYCYMKRTEEFKMIHNFFFLNFMMCILLYDRDIW